MMGLFGFLFGGRDSAPAGQTPLQPIPIDLEYFSCGESRLGGAVLSQDYFCAALRANDVLDDQRNGIEVGANEGVLDYVFLDVKKFPGRFSKAGMDVHLGTTTTEAQVLDLFGEPYWTDRSDGEVILFYEYAGGTIELQFEFSDGRMLSFITLARNGVLSSEEQRRAYGVTKPWPPNA